MLRILGRAAAIAVAVIPLLVSGAADAHERPTTLVAAAEGTHLSITIEAATDYCASDAVERVVRAPGSIRIIRDRPSRVSRCIATRDHTVMVGDVEPGTYVVTYERVPLVAPARALVVARTTVVVP